MSLRRHLLGLCTFVLLSAVVVFNALYLKGLRSKTADGATAAIAFNVSPLVPAVNAIAATAPDSTAAVASSNVAAIQRELEVRGFAPGAADGIVNPVTRAAIFAFELEQGLPLTAEPGEAVLQTLILGSSTGAAPMRPEAQRPGPEAEKLIRRIQRDLAALGYGPFQNPGRLADETSRAISKFERDQNMQVTGRVNAPLVSRLMRLAPQEARRTPS